MADVAFRMTRKITSKLDILCSDEFHKNAKTNLVQYFVVSIEIKLINPATSLFLARYMFTIYAGHLYNGSFRFLVVISFGILVVETNEVFLCFNLVDSGNIQIIVHISNLLRPRVRISQVCSPFAL